MRVLKVCNVYYPELEFGGPPQKIHSLACGLLARGHQVTVATFASKEPSLRNLVVRDGIKVQYISWIGKGLYQFPRSIGILRQCVSRADIVHCYGLYDIIGPMAMYYARRLRRPYVMEPMGMLVPRSGLKLLKRCYHALITFRASRSAAAVIGTSEAEMYELKGLPARRLVLRRNGIDLAKFARLPSPAVFRERLKLRAEQRVILFVGRITPIKNLEQLIIAFDKANISTGVLVLAGPAQEASYANRVRALIAERGLTDRVRLIGPIYGDDHLGGLAAAEILVLPSLSESFGNAAAEAVAAGVPVLITDSCGIAPIIHRRAGLSVPCSEAALSAGIRILLTDSRTLAGVTSKGAEVLKELSWDEPLDSLAELYRELT